MKNAEIYADVIMRDEREKIVEEKSVIYEATKIVRLYELADGAIVRYEWQDFPTAQAGENFNHRFTLEELPKPNQNKLEKGVIKIIEYPR